MKLSDKQRDKISKLCDKWQDCVPYEMSNGELIVAVSLFLGTFVFVNAENTEILDCGLMEIAMNAKSAYNIINKEKQL